MSLFKKGNKAYSIFHQKCPRCHEADLFTNKLSSMKGVFSMPERCPRCNQDFVIEPGFYWGSMYVAYALSSGIMLSGFAVLFFLFDLELKLAFGIVLVIVLLLYGFIFRLSRSIWINMYVHYKAPAVP